MIILNLILCKDIDADAKRIQNTINLRLQQKQFADNNYTNNNSVLIKTTIRNLHNNVNQYNLKISKQSNTKNTSTSPEFTYLNHSFKSLRYPQQFLVQKRRPIENGVIPPEHKELNDKETVQQDEARIQRNQ